MTVILERGPKGMSSTDHSRLFFQHADARR